jgi:hypothetical protein
VILDTKNLGKTSLGTTSHRDDLAEEAEDHDDHPWRPGAPGGRAATLGGQAAAC